MPIRVILIILSDKVSGVHGASSGHFLQIKIFTLILSA